MGKQFPAARVPPASDAKHGSVGLAVGVALGDDVGLELGLFVGGFEGDTYHQL